MTPTSSISPTPAISPTSTALPTSANPANATQGTFNQFAGNSGYQFSNPDIQAASQLYTPGLFGATGSAAPSISMTKSKRGGLAKMADGGMMETSMMDPWFERREANQPSSGFMGASVAGRTDRLPVAVAADSYVIPADVVSGLGQGNSLAGARILNEALRTGPWGTPVNVHETRANAPRPPHEFTETDSAGGKTHHMPIIVAGGEFIVSPEAVRRVGEGDTDKGHKRLHEMVKRVRAHTIKKTKSLPQPKK